MIQTGTGFEVADLEPTVLNGHPPPIVAASPLNSPDRGPWCNNSRRRASDP